MEKNLLFIDLIFAIELDLQNKKNLKLLYNSNE
jgi:hypothetical protein